MEKVKKISINKIDEVMKQHFNEPTIINWFDNEVVIRKNITLREMLEFVNDITEGCIGEDGAYIPEAMDLIIRSNILTKYANFSLPDNIEHRYDIVYGTDIVDYVRKYINEAQLFDIIESAKKKIEYLCGSNILAVQKQIERVAAEFENMQEQISSVFDNITPDDIQAISSAITSGGIDEEKIVRAYLSQTSDTSQEE